MSPKSGGDEANVNNNDATLDYEYGGFIIIDGPIEYSEFNILITVGHFRMGRRYAVIGFYIQFSRRSKQGGKKLVIIYVLCAKALDGTSYDQ